jgi:hypothetical protein
MQEVIKWFIFVWTEVCRHNIKLFILFFFRKVLCVSCWNGSKTCISEVSQCKLILAENLSSGPPAILVPQIVVGKAAEPPLVVEQQHTAPVVLLAADAIPIKVAEEEKQKEELEKIAPAEERQRETEEKEEAEEYNIVAEEKQSLDEAEENIEAEEKEEEHNQLQLEVENGETNEDKLDGHEMIRGRYISVLSAIIY